MSATLKTHCDTRRSLTLREFHLDSEWRSWVTNCQFAVDISADASADDHTNPALTPNTKALEEYANYVADALSSVCRLRDAVSSILAQETRCSSGEADAVAEAVDATQLELTRLREQSNIYSHRLNLKQSLLEKAVGVSNARIASLEKQPHSPKEQSRSATTTGTTRKNDAISEYTLYVASKGGQEAGWDGPSHQLFESMRRRKSAVLDRDNFVLKATEVFSRTQEDVERHLLHCEKLDELRHKKRVALSAWKRNKADLHSTEDTQHETVTSVVCAKEEFNPQRTQALERWRQERRRQLAAWLQSRREMEALQLEQQTRDAEKQKLEIQKRLKANQKNIMGRKWKIETKAKSQNTQMAKEMQQVKRPSQSDLQRIREKSEALEHRRTQRLAEARNAIKQSQVAMAAIQAPKHLHSVVSKYLCPTTSFLRRKEAVEKEKQMPAQTISTVINSRRAIPTWRSVALG